MGWGSGQPLLPLDDGNPAGSGDDDTACNGSGGDDSGGDEGGGQGSAQG
ncbi:MAG: hypothetical protein VKJ44_02535 [Synechococcus sp.]|nr:hypothetical protein [Synechococcus sp.]